MQRADFQRNLRSDRQTDGQVGRQTERQTGRRTERCCKKRTARKCWTYHLTPIEVEPAGQCWHWRSTLSINPSHRQADPGLTAHALRTSRAQRSLHWTLTSRSRSHWRSHCVTWRHNLQQTNTPSLSVMEWNWLRTLAHWPHLVFLILPTNVGHGVR